MVGIMTLGPGKTGMERYLRTGIKSEATDYTIPLEKYTVPALVVPHSRAVW